MYKELNIFDNNFYFSKLTEDEKIKCKIDLLILLNKFNNKIIPKKINKNLLSSFYLRSSIISKQGFAILTKEWIKELVKFIGNKKCLEIMSGCGALTKQLKNYNVDIIATDDFSWGEDGTCQSLWNSNKNYWTDIENIDCVEAIKKYGKDRDIIIMSWPYMDDNANKVLQTMREINPNAVLIYIGENEGGCTASEDFFNNMININNRQIDCINGLFPSWFGIYDRIYLIK